MSEVAKEIIDFWMNKVGPANWYQSDATLDAEIKARFETTWENAKNGDYCSWMCTPEGCLALVLILDQFPRKMFKGTAQAYASDRAALSAAKRGIVMGHDLKIMEPQRQFLYMPMMHSESLMDQERCVRLISLRMLRVGGEGLLHAKAHRDVIRQFGRFPYRNEILGRASTSPELAYMTAGGYDYTINTIAA